ncbi:peptide-methionine (R)-S-oxide reductase MsrB [Anaerohalosphaera lusitana]
MSYEVEKSEQQWREDLTRDQYNVLREGGTEKPFTGKYYKFFEDGVYKCGACGEELFYSKDKFDSGCGWPAFAQPTQRENIEERIDKSHGMVRTEIRCAKCGSHLGHVFTDGPAPTGLRYCVNSAALEFNAMIGTEKKEEK